MAGAWEAGRQKSTWIRQTVRGAGGGGASDGLRRRGTGRGGADAAYGLPRQAFSLPSPQGVAKGRTESSMSINGDGVEQGRHQRIIAENQA